MNKFPIPTLTAAALFGALMLVVHKANPSKGLDLRALAPALQLPAPQLPVHALPLPGVPAQLAIADPNSPNWTPASAANFALVTPELVDGDGALDHFYAALHQLSNGERTTPVRIVHYGDSPTTADLITGDARETLQSVFGNAGPGFILIAKPWAWYGHRGVDVSGSGWTIATAVGQMRAGTYGLGGANFIGEPGTESTITVSAANATSIELQYLAQPGAGTVEIVADGQSAGTIDTAAGTREDGAQSLPIPPGTKHITLRVQRAAVTLFGTTLSTGQRGLTYDSIGLNGASTTVLSRGFAVDSWAPALAHRAPDLVIINYGTNESGYLGFVDHQYEAELRIAIGRVRASVPEASILIMSPMDRGQRAGGDDITTMPGIPHLVAIQRRVAAELHCGFFNTYAAMGGDGTMSRWYNGHPRLVAADFIHPTPQGAAIVAQTLTSQLLTGYERYLEVQAKPARLEANAKVAK